MIYRYPMFSKTVALIHMLTTKSVLDNLDGNSFPSLKDLVPAEIYMTGGICVRVTENLRSKNGEGLN